ncbi:MAG: sugar phosphate isomerase/epimerase, partial [Phycisphaerales bacterium]|nr:sugar phosphate isomerase/epimerase [Phycisphaerales bacterium]
KQTARAAARFGVHVVNGFTGSSVWHKLYFFPPTSEDEIDAGFDDFAKRWGPILDVFEELDVKFALEVHPTEIAYDFRTAERALEALNYHDAFGFNFDPSHLVWQGVDPARFIDRFADRIFHVHMKDAATTLDGESSILASHLQFGDHRRGWDFRSVGRGDVDFESIIRSLNRAGYDGPLSVEWEDSAMDREHGAAESCEFVRSIDFPANERAFDAAFDKDEQ